jgi:hypothetical protein
LFTFNVLAFSVAVVAVFVVDSDGEMGLRFTIVFVLFAVRESIDADTDGGYDSSSVWISVVEPEAPTLGQPSVEMRLGTLRSLTFVNVSCFMSQ